VGPLLIGRGDHVDVAVQQQWRCVAAGHAPEEIRSVGVSGVGIVLDSVFVEQVANPLDTGALVARRVDRLEANQILEEFGRLFVTCRRYVRICP